MVKAKQKLSRNYKKGSYEEPRAYSRKGQERVFTLRSKYIMKKPKNYLLHNTPCYKDHELHNYNSNFKRILILSSFHTKQKIG